MGAKGREGGGAEAPNGEAERGVMGWTQPHQHVPDN